MPAEANGGTSGTVLRALLNDWRAIVAAPIRRDHDSADTDAYDRTLLDRARAVSEAKRMGNERVRNHTDPVPVDVQTLPGWLRAAVFLGVPSVIAMFLVYFLTIGLQNAVAEIQSTQRLQMQTVLRVQESVTEQQAASRSTREHFDQSVMRLERLVRRACLVAASTTEERATCLADN